MRRSPRSTAAEPSGTSTSCSRIRTIDGVLVATPHSTHADIAVRAAEAGKHVFVEKPLALTVADAERVAEAAAGAPASWCRSDTTGGASPPTAASRR